MVISPVSTPCGATGSRILFPSIDVAHGMFVWGCCSFTSASTAWAATAGAAADPLTTEPGFAADAANATAMTSAISAASTISAAATASADISTACTRSAATTVTDHAYDTAITSYWPVRVWLLALLLAAPDPDTAITNCMYTVDCYCCDCA